MAMKRFVLELAFLIVPDLEYATVKLRMMLNAEISKIVFLTKIVAKSGVDD
jgi:hypothetical protein